MRRRDFLTGAAAFAGAAAATRIAGAPRTDTGTAAAGRLDPPKRGRIPVAVTISSGVTVIDFCGPWEVFQDASPDGAGEGGFELYTVSETLAPLRATAGLQIVPDYTFATAPAPRVVVVPAQKGSAALHDWLRRTSQTADVTMSVCTGAFQLAKAGLLSGREATTHHDFLDRLATQYPDVKVKRGVRYVEGPKISSAAGLTSGIDLALRVVERYFGRATAERTAGYMEYNTSPPLR